MSQAPIILKEYDPSWKIKFEKEKQHLIEIAGKWNYGSIEHIGSTAIQGMVAKPVIDVMFGIKSLEASKSAISTLEKNGYKHWPYKAEVMYWFCKPSDRFRTHHLHLIPFESPLWNERIKFRELLLSNNTIATEYADLKRKLAVLYKDDREKYTDEKWPFIQNWLQGNL